MWLVLWVIITCLRQRFLIGTGVSLQLFDDRAAKAAVLGELRLLLIRVRHPSPVLYRQFLEALTARGSVGHLNLSSAGYKATVSWIQTRAADLRNRTLQELRIWRNNARAAG